MATSPSTVLSPTQNAYVPRGRNVIRTIFENHFKDFVSKNSGFSVDNSIRIYGNDNKAREALSQYIAKPPVSLEKIKYEPIHEESAL